MSYFKNPALSGDIAETMGEINDTVRPVSTLAMAYHGYKRTKSVGWALGWAAFGAFAPLLAPVIAVAEGFGKPRSGG